jgi:galactokinase
VRHAHAASGYNQRRAECLEAVRLLKQAGFAIESLRDVELDRLEEALRVLPDVLGRRVRHVVRENGRTSAAVDALKRAHLPGLGRLMNGSHASLRDDYEVSSPELDYLVELAQRTAGVLGARMTGGGFGGSVVALVKSDSLARACDCLDQGYRERFRADLDVTVTEASEGMRHEAVAQA